MDVSDDDDDNVDSSTPDSVNTEADDDASDVQDSASSPSSTDTVDAGEQTPFVLGGTIWDTLRKKKKTAKKQTSTPSSSSSSALPIVASADGTGEKSISDLPSSSAHVFSVEPQTLKEALQSPDRDQWLQAVHEELAAMEANDVYEVINAADVPNATKLLSSRMVFKRKLDEQGNIVKYKARWVAKGFSQIKGVNYSETFAPTATITAIRSMIAMALQRRMVIQQMDVSTAFLNAKLDHDIYVKPPAVAGKYPPNTVLKLKRSLYGLKQSPRLWNHTLDEWMRSEGFTPTATDPCIYTKQLKPKQLIWVSVFVDDLLIFSDCNSAMTAFKAAISKRFKMKDIGSPGLCLGIKMQHNASANTMTLSQEHYIQHVLDCYNMADCRPVGTPLDVGYQDAPADKDVPLPDVPYRSLIGALLYAATMTRPDIATAVSILCRHMQHYNMDHWRAAKHLLRYLKGTTHYHIHYDGSTTSAAAAMIGYSDASYGSDPATMRSRTGYVIMRSSGPVSWKTKLQPTIATASADAEYMAMASAAQEIMFLRQLEEELLGTKLPHPTTLMVDNQPAMSVANRAATRMRHILIKFHYIRNCVDNKWIQLEYLPTAKMIADLMTKILPKPKTLEFSTAMLNTRPLTEHPQRARLTRASHHADNTDLRDQASE